MTQKRKGPRHSSTADTTLDLGSDEAPNVFDDDSGFGITRQEQDVRDGADASNPTPKAEEECSATAPLYDSGWTVRDWFKDRVRWYGVPDDGKRQRWATNLLLGDRAR